MKIFYQPVISHSQFICLLFSVLMMGSAGNAVAVAGLQQTDFVYFEDTDPVLSDPLQALSVFTTDGDATISVQSYQPPFNVGNVDKYFWFHSRLTNHSEQPQSLRLLARLAYRQLLNIYVVDHSGTVTRILKEGVNNVFSDRAYPHRWQISSRFILPAGQPADLLVQYHAMGSSYLPLQVVDEFQLLEIIREDTVSAALFYSFSIAAILLFLLFGLAMQDKTSMLYAALFLLALLMLAAMEGYAFMHLWPQWPRWNHFSAVVIAYLFCSLGFYVAASAVEPSQQRRTISSTVLKLLRVFAAVSLAMAVLVFYLPFVFMVEMTNLFIALMFIAHAYAIAGWLRVEPGRLLKRNVIAMVSAVLISLVVVALILLSLNVDILPAYFYVHSSRVIFILSGLATMATIISHVSGLRKDYEVSLEQAVRAATREAEINRALFQSEQKYNRVRALAAQRRQQLAEASHDIRQPLISLRATVDALMLDQKPQLKNQLTNAFDYLENLCSNYLRETTPTGLPDDVPEATYNNLPANEPCSVSMVLDTVKRMFDAEAQCHDIHLKVQPSSATIHAEPTVVLRIVCNLVANAIKHAGPCRLVLGVRRRAAGIAIVVVDNGRGIAPAMMDSILQAYQKGPQSTGEGLGLAICRQQAEQHRMQLEISSVEGRGTCCQLLIFRH